MQAERLHPVGRQLKPNPGNVLGTATSAEVRSVVPQPAALSPELRAAVSDYMTRQVPFGRSSDALRALVRDDLGRTDGRDANALFLGSPDFPRC
jgi:hypothetical protein